MNDSVAGDSRNPFRFKTLETKTANIQISLQRTGVGGELEWAKTDEYEEC